MTFEELPPPDPGNVTQIYLLAILERLELLIYQHRSSDREPDPEPARSLQCFGDPADAVPI